MATVWSGYRAELRRRWASWLALAALVAVVAGTVLTGASAARRTDAAFPDYLHRYGYDALVYEGGPTLSPKITHMPGVSGAETMPFFIGGAGFLAAGQLVPPNPTVLMALPPDPSRAFTTVVSGRLPVGPTEAAVGYEMSESFHLHVGSMLRIPLYLRSQEREVYESSGNPPAHGPIVHLRVVGVLASTTDFPTGSPVYDVYTGPGFERSYARRVVIGAIAYVRLRGGATALPRFTNEVNNLHTSAYFLAAEPLDDGNAAVAGSIHPQVLGWWLFALLAALAGLALVGQALSRQSVVAREAYPTFSALGARPSQLLAIGLLRAATVGLVGAAGAVVMATALSPLVPVGEARAAEASHGVVVDATVFGLGGLAVVLVVVLLGLVPAIRASQVRRLQTRHAASTGTASSQIAGFIAGSGAPPTLLIGVRHALERGRGRNAVPVATALVGTTAAVIALVATSVFGSSMSTLLSTPSLYGQDFQVVLGGLNATDVHAVVATFGKDPQVARLSYAQPDKLISVNGVSVAASLTVSPKGPLIYSIADGRRPTGPGELALGTQTLRAVGAQLGSLVHVAVIGPKGHVATGTMRVVGTVVVPPALAAFGGSGLGVGAVLTLPAALDFVCGPHATCRSEILGKLDAAQNGDWGVAIATVSGPEGAATVRRIERVYPQFLQVLTVPTNLVNFGQAVNFPLLVGATLVLFGVATMAHLLLASAARRRREFAVLKVLGFVHRQVRASVLWQATTVALVGIVLGVPIGLVVGNLVWRTYAGNIGVVPLVVIPIALLAAIVVGVVVVGDVLAAVPAVLAARAPAAAALREE
jgi:FtsX-like permease family